MENSIAIAEQALLNPTGLSIAHGEKIISQVAGNGIDFADLYFQVTQQEAWVLEDGIVKDAEYNLDHGVGIRAISGDKSGFAYSDDIVLPALENAAKAARSIVQLGGSGKVSLNTQRLKHQLYNKANPLQSLTEIEKINLLQRADQYARQKDSRIQQVIASISGSYDIILVMNSEGHLVADVRPLIRFNINIIASNGKRLEQATAGGGGRLDYKTAFSEATINGYVDEAVRQALLNLEAVAAPAGTMPVVLGPGWPGILLHEAIGHGLEGDFNRKGTSAFSGRIGERVATPLCTVVDDGTLNGRRGSLNVDDEGVPTQCTVLIENGILKGYMQDKLNAKLMKEASTGNGRRESYAALPMPRMTNTYMLGGSHHKEEIIQSVKKGLYAANFGGGQVDITSGKFVFSASEAYLIEDGKLTAPVKGATLIGNGPDVLTKVSMLGNDMTLDSGVGVCGKDGQSVPVGVGQPTVKIDELTVGGTATDR